MSASEPPGVGSARGRAGGLFAWARRQVLLFLEIIGLREESGGVYEARLARFRLHHTAFRTLLSANDSFLTTIADLEERLRRADHFDAAFVKRRVVRAVADVHRMVESLDEISEGRYPTLRPAFEAIAERLTACVQDASAHAEHALVLDLPEIWATHADIVGGKMANLGEVRNAVGLPTPDGFAVTTAGFHLFARTAAEQAGADDRAPGGDGRAGGSGRRERLLNCPVPGVLEEAVLAAYDRLATRLGGPPRVAVRSSALGEDGPHSFAGQFLTLLNVARDDAIDAYRQVAASLHSPEAESYRRLHGIPDESAAMAVGFVTMVDAAASGIAYSRDPRRRDDAVLIQAVHGLGVTLADGGTTAESIRAGREGEPPSLERATSEQATRTICLDKGGVREELIEHGGTPRRCLDDAEARAIARWALVLEAHFGGPQDVEWAVDVSRRAVVLQSRPLRLPAGIVPSGKPVDGFEVLVRGGETACPGAASGVAVRMDEDGDLEAFPDGGVLVARRSSPRFVRLLSKARAIVTDAGSVTGHMASLARELHLPTLLATATATRDIPAGSVITVDAGAGIVYRGEVPGLTEATTATQASPPEGHPLRETAAFAMLEQVVALTVPLNLTDARARDFAPEACRTIHDIARFVHEKSYAEMFRIGEHLGDARSTSFALDVFLPMDLYIIDLGGGVQAPAVGRKVKPAHITSVPLQAVLRGMLDRRLPRFGPKPIDVGGLVSVMFRHAMSNPEADQTFRDPCYAIVSDAYLNYTARVGYHFGVVDCYCSPSPNRNYISFRFKGGAADRIRRARRAQAIAGVLREKGFTTEVKGDQVAAQLGKASQEEIATQLEMLGRLLQFFRQMDASMATDEAVDRFRDAFLHDDFRLLGNGGNGAATPTE